MERQTPIKPDALNAIGVLTRREIEARLVAPLLQAYARQMGRKQAVAILRQAIAEIARQQGEALAVQMGGCSLTHLAASLDAWKQDDAMRMEVLQQDEQRFHFNVTRCLYAEMYAELGLADLGFTLSCNRDAALVSGFNPAIRLERSQTIMEGAPYCDFRYTLQLLEEDQPMKTLLIMRHAKSSWKEGELADRDRPLNKRGMRDAPRIGRLLREENLVPDQILCSFAVRALATAQSVADQCGYPGDLNVSEALYACSAETCLDALRALPTGVETALLIGHNPGLEELLEWLTGEEEHLPTAAVAQVRLPIPSWEAIGVEGQGKLLKIWRPRELP